MPTFYPSVPDDLRAWALAQPFFFTATAPTYGAHVNVSPKGHTGSSFAILGPNACAYLDATGSGCETAAHLRDNGRITLMWMSLGASPRIMRFFCRGRVVERGGTGARGSDEFEAILQKMRDSNGGQLAALPVQAGKGTGGDRGWRAVIVMHIFKAQTSCGWGVPVMTGLPAAADATDRAPSDAEQGHAGVPAAPNSLDDIRATVQQTAAQEAAGVASGGAVYKGPAYAPRVTLANFMAVLGKKDGAPGVEYQMKNNAASLDGLPGYRSARRARLTRGSVAERARSVGEMAGLRVKVVGTKLWREMGAVVVALVVGLLVGLVMGMGWEDFLRRAGEWMVLVREAVVD